MTASPVFAGLRVLDCTDGVAGQYCGRLLADYGAEVVLVEGPDGSAVRRAPSWVGSAAVPGRDAVLFHHLNTGKRSCTVDRASAQGRDRLAALAATADVVIADDEELCRSLMAQQPRLIACLLTEFGRGPFEGWHGSELIFQALGGVMFGNTDFPRRPLYGIGHRALYSAGVTAFNAVAAALVERQRTGHAQLVEVSVHDAMATMNSTNAARYFYNRSFQPRDRPVGFLGLLKCADSWVVIYAARPTDWTGCCAVFDLPEHVVDERFADLAARYENWDEAMKILAPAAAVLPVETVLTRARAHKLPLSRVLDGISLLDDRHLVERGFWELTDAGELTLGAAFRLSASPRGPARSAPALGEADADLARVVTGAPLPEAPPAADVRGRRPLDGVRVVDLTGAWAGPTTTRALAFLGAEIIKIEGPGRPDSWRESIRGGEVSRYPDREPGERPYNRSHRFNGQNHDKHGMVVDLKKPEGVTLVLDLVRQADVVIDNFSPRVMQSLGLDYERLRAVNPDVIMVEMPAYGNTGPDAFAVAFGPNMEAMTGMVSMIGYGDGTPMVTSNAYLDPIGGQHAVAAVLSALYHRGRTGRGQYVEVPQRETAMQFVGEILLEQARTGKRFVADGNAVPYAAPHDAFPALGDDEWVAIAALTDEQWTTLCRTVGLSSLIDDPDYATMADRRRNAKALYERVAERTRLAGKWTLAEALQAAGVPAAPVCNGRDVALNPQSWARELFVDLDHTDAGRQWYVGLPYRLEATPGRVERAAPLFGEHNHEVLSRVLGLSAERIAELDAAGVISSEPVRRG